MATADNKPSINHKHKCVNKTVTIAYFRKSHTECGYPRPDVFQYVFLPIVALVLNLQWPENTFDKHYQHLCLVYLEITVVIQRNSNCGDNKKN